MSWNWCDKLLCFYVKSIFKQLRKIAKTLLHAWKTVFGGSIEKPEFLFLSKKNVAYLVVSKAACSSIKKAMIENELRENIEDNYQIHQNERVREFTVRGRLKVADKPYVFTYVRNPFSRLVSAYVNKFEDFKKIKSVGFEYAEYLGGWLELSDSFEQFVKKVCEIPDRLSDRHFMGQYFLIHTLSDIRPDDIFKLEDMDKTFPMLASRFGFGEVPHFNRTAGYCYEDYYSSPELVEMVYQRYREDVDKFGYHDVYRSLMSQF